MAGLRREDAVPLVVTLPALALFAWWVADKGGYFPVQWMPGALALLWLVAVVMTLSRAGLPRPQAPLLVALGALAAYTAWSFASIAWARAPGVALEGSARTLLYFACFALFALAPWTPRAARAALGAFVAAVTVSAIVTLARASAVQPGIDLFINGRLAAPLDYQNASAALWTMAALPALGLAASRATPLVARAPLLAASGFLLGMAVLSQSRGWLFTLPVVALLALAVVRGADRARLLVHAIVVGAVLAPALSRLLEPYDVGGGLRDPAQVASAVHASMTSAARALVLVAVALLVLGALLAWADERLSARIPARAGTAFVVVMLVGAAAAGLVAARGHPVDRARSGWADFKDFRTEGQPVGGSRFTDLSSVRYDFWTVGMDAWQAHPLGGLGQDNFAGTYVRERGTPYAAPRWVHSLELRALVHTGLIGAVLLLAFLAAAAFGALRGSPGAAQQAGAVALLPAIDWLVHGSLDWFWEYPGLTAPALAFAATAAVLGQDSDKTMLRIAVRGRTFAIAVAVVGSAVLVRAYAAELQVNRAVRGWDENAPQAFKRLDDAQSLNPLDAHSALVEGVIAVQVGDLRRARDAFVEATKRDPDGWLAPLQLGLIASAQGDRAAATRRLRSARSHNPRSPVIAEALRRVSSRQPMTLAEAAGALARESAQQQGRPVDTPSS
jgi:hypothetical protein